MKFDILTIAAAIFTLGVLVTSLDLQDAFAGEAQAPTALHQGIPQK